MVEQRIWKIPCERICSIFIKKENNASMNIFYIYLGALMGLFYRMNSWE